MITFLVFQGAARHCNLLSLPTDLHSIPFTLVVLMQGRKHGCTDNSLMFFNHFDIISMNIPLHLSFFQR